MQRFYWFAIIENEISGPSKESMRQCELYLYRMAVWLQKCRVGDSLYIKVVVTILLNIGHQGDRCTDTDLICPWISPQHLNFLPLHRIILIDGAKDRKSVV